MTELNLVSDEKLLKLTKDIIDGYITLVKLYFMIDKNKFDEYSLNYQEINFNHSFDPADLILPKE